MTKRIRVKWDYEGASAEGLRWSRMSAMVEAIAEALSIAAPDVDPDEVVPVVLKSGSVRMDLQVPVRAEPYLATFAAQAMNGNAPKLSALVRKLNAKVKVSIGGGWRELRFEHARTPGAIVRSTTTYVAQVESVGGVEPRVRLRMPNDETFSAKVDEATAVKLGAFLYQEIQATIELSFDQSTRQVVARQILSFEPFDLPPRQPIKIPAEPSPDLEFKSVAEFLEDRHG